MDAFRFHFSSHASAGRRRWECALSVIAWRPNGRQALTGAGGGS